MVDVDENTNLYINRIILVIDLNGAAYLTRKFSLIS